MDCEGISNNGSESDEGSFMDNSRSEDSPPCSEELQNEEGICNNDEGVVAAGTINALVVVEAV